MGGENTPVTGQGKGKDQYGRPFGKKQTQAMLEFSKVRRRLSVLQRRQLVRFVVGTAILALAFCIHATVVLRRLPACRPARRAPRHQRGSAALLLHARAAITTR